MEIALKSNWYKLVLSHLISYKDLFGDRSEVKLVQVGIPSHVISYKDLVGDRSEVKLVQVGTVSSNQLQGFVWRSL